MASEREAVAELTAVQADRAAGTLAGLATGDALGAGYEFGTPPDGEAGMIGGGLGGWEPGEWTDDTQMPICIAKAAAGSLDARSVGEEFLAWYRSGPADVGIQTRAVLSGAASAVDGRAFVLRLSCCSEGSCRRIGAIQHSTRCRAALAAPGRIR